MADQTDRGTLAGVAQTIGSSIGKVVSAVSGAIAPAPAKAELWSAESIGSGTFIIHKPKRKPHKRRQTKLHSRNRGMRK